MKRLTTNILMLILFSLPFMELQGQTGKAIMENVYERKNPSSGKSDMKMTLKGKRGNERIRKIHQFFLDDGEVEKRIMFFQAPADVRNTSFMNWTYDSDKDDDQWLYLPALGKVKRISGDSKGDRFMGSDFTYDDMSERKPEEDDHKILRTETMNGKEVYVVENQPKDKDELYSKTITWVEKDRWVPLKKEFYDKDGKLLKVLHVEGFQKIDGFWIITKKVMKHKQDDHQTIIDLTNIKVNTGLSDSKFTQRMMKRGL